jgi:RHS repeat-associated protein
VATSSTGAVLDRAEYGPWGNVRSGNVSETTLNYTGQKRDGTGLLYYGARYYDPAMGRFLSPDTMGVSAGDPQSLNRYSYVRNNPLNRTDPTGHCFQDECDPAPPDPGAGGGNEPGYNGPLNNDPIPGEPGGGPSNDGSGGNGGNGDGSPGSGGGGSGQVVKPFEVTLTLSCQKDGGSPDCPKKDCLNDFFCAGSGHGTPPIGGTVQVQTPYGPGFATVSYSSPDSGGSGGSGNTNSGNKPSSDYRKNVDPLRTYAVAGRVYQGWAR